MNDAPRPANRTPFWRLGFFLRDFLPEHELQWLFPLGTFLLLIGWEYWRGFPGARLQAGSLAASVTISIVLRFCYTASFILWIVPVRNPSRAFFRWVFLPLILGVLGSLLILPIGYLSPSSRMESVSQILVDQVRALPLLLRAMGYRFFAPCAGVIVLAFALRGVRKGEMPLPVRFRGVDAGPRDSGAPALSRRFCTFIVASLLLSVVFELIIEFVLFSRRGLALSRPFTWPRGYTLWEWITLVYPPTVAGLCAMKILGESPAEPTIPPVRSFKLDYGVAVVLPLAIALGARMALKVFGEFIFAVSAPDWLGFPPTWREIFDSNHGFPWVLVVFLGAWLIEFVLRRFVQDRLTGIFGLQRTIFLTALVWWVLPVLKGFGPVPNLRIPVPGIAEIISLLSTILFNIPLGWLYARTRSLWLVTLMHGTILLFRQGSSAYSFYFNYPWVYWVETAAWIAASWYLVRLQKQPASPRRYSASL
jgi:hypothetical protein